MLRWMSASLRKQYLLSSRCSKVQLGGARTPLAGGLTRLLLVVRLERGRAGAFPHVSDDVLLRPCAFDEQL